MQNKCRCIQMHVIITCTPIVAPSITYVGWPQNVFGCSQTAAEVETKWIVKDTRMIDWLQLSILSSAAACASSLMTLMSSSWASSSLSTGSMHTKCGLSSALSLYSVIAELKSKFCDCDSFSLRTYCSKVSSVSSPEQLLACQQCQLCQLTSDDCH